MPEYLVVFDQSELASSDAAVGTKPTPNSEVTAPVQTAKIATVTADCVADAVAVTIIAYNGSSNVPVVYANEPLVDEVPAEVSTPEPLAEKSADSEQSTEPVEETKTSPFV